MRRTYFFCLLAVICTACNKEVQDIAPMNEELFAVSGNLSVQTGYSDATSLKTLAGQKVYIRVDTGINKSLTNYFYSTTTGGGGNFTFYVSDTTIPYAVFTVLKYESSPAYSLMYYGTVKTITPFTSALPLIATPDTITQNGLNLTAQDLIGSRVGRAKLALYISETIAVSDGLSLTGNGCLLKSATDSMGRAFISNLPEDKLFINAQVISGKDTFYTVAQPVQVLKRQIVPITLTLLKK